MLMLWLVGRGYDAYYDDNSNNKIKIKCGDNGDEICIGILQPDVATFWKYDKHCNHYYVRENQWFANLNICEPSFFSDLFRLLELNILDESCSKFTFKQTCTISAG